MASATQIAANCRNAQRSTGTAATIRSTIGVRLDADRTVGVALATLVIRLKSLGRKGREGA
jgi:hypothetical protein